MTKVNNKKRKKNPALIWVMFVSQSYSILASYCFLMLHGFIPFCVAIRIPLHMLARCFAQVKHGLMYEKKMSEKIYCMKYNWLPIANINNPTDIKKAIELSNFLCRDIITMAKFFVERMQNFHHFLCVDDTHQICKFKKGFYTANKISH